MPVEREFVVGVLVSSVAVIVAGIATILYCVCIHLGEYHSEVDLFRDDEEHDSQDENPNDEIPEEL